MGDLSAALSTAVERARALSGGAPAAYIPELALVDPEQTSAAIHTVEGVRHTAGDADQHRFTLQSVAKLLLLTGMLEERGAAVFDVVAAEPTGRSFASLAWMERNGPRPANPLVNPGAIALCGQLEGLMEDRLGWIERWCERLLGRPAPINSRVMASERRTGHRNRAIAHTLRANGSLSGDVDETLEVYFGLCSTTGDVAGLARFAAVLARAGTDPDTGVAVISRRTAGAVVALMATCGMYDESGAHLLHTGLPAKSGVSGAIVAVAPGIAGLAVASPRINAKGGSIRGHAILRELSDGLGWHFARPPIPGVEPVG